MAPPLRYFYFFHNLSWDPLLRCGYLGYNSNGYSRSRGHPLHLTWRALVYWGWLIVEIIKANIDVVKLVLSPTSKISPTMVRVRASQQTDLGQVVYANSITLTPGTISVDVANDEILVHALSETGARDLLGGEMDRRVSKMAGE